MKLISTFLFTIMSCSMTLATARDSVGIFISADKTMVMVTEGGVGARLQKWMKHIEQPGRIVTGSADNSFKMDCVREDVSIVRCSFRFMNSENVARTNRTVEAHLPLKELGIANENPLELSFQSSNGDQFDIVISDGLLHLYARKK